MAITNKFKVYGESSSNLWSDTDYSTNNTRQNGALATEVISSKTTNTALKGPSMIGVAMIDALATYNTNATFTVGLETTMADLTTYFTSMLDGFASAKTTITTNTANDDVISFTINGHSYSKTVNNVAHATSSQNVDALTTESANNDTVKFTIGDKTYTKKINDVEHAGYSTNVGTLTNNDSGDNAVIDFSIGDKGFRKRVNNVAHATRADVADYANPYDGRWNNVTISSSGNGTLMRGDGIDGTYRDYLFRDKSYIIVGVPSDELLSIEFGIVYCFGNRKAHASCTLANGTTYTLEIDATGTSAMTTAKAYKNSSRVLLTVRFMLLGV